MLSFINYHDFFFVLENDGFQWGCFEEEIFFRYTLKWPSAYLLIPKNALTREGRQNVTVTPFQLFWAQNNQHSNHPATKFACARINTWQEIAGLLVPKQVTFNSQDDKAKVALGLPATNKQVSILMHIEYEVRLPDHDFTVAPMHKLRPSVIVPWKNVFKRGFYILWPYICSNHECQTQPIQCFTSLRGHEAHSLIRWS